MPGLVDDFRKSLKKKEPTFSDEINQENRFAEGDEPSSSDSDDNSDSTDENSSEISTDDNEEFKNMMEYDIIIKEQDFEKNESLRVSGDVYNYTICAHMTGCTSPLKKAYCLK